MTHIPPSPPAHVAGYVRISCKELADAVPKQGQVSAWYGSLLAEALHRHGFDSSWPHVPATVIAQAVTDWTGCFAPEKPVGTGKK